MFYHEFCQWDKNDDKQSGIVLTPEDIVKLMVSELSIDQSDKVLDFCCGTGSFIIECGKHTDKLYACECSDERYSLAKCNFILNDYCTKNLIYSSCFDYPYKSNTFDKVIINPPFSLDCQDNLNIDNNTLGWTEFTKEQRFVIYAIELLKPGGIGCMIIPRSNFDVNNKNKQRAIFKQRILECCHVLKIINCNPKVFYPVANVECAIIVVQKREQPIEITSEYATEITTIDYSQDGYTTSKNKRYKTASPNPIETTKTITPSSNWNYEQIVCDIDVNELNNMIIDYNIDYEASTKKLFFRQQPTKIIKPVFKQCLLTDFLRIIPFKGYQTNSTQPGKYPLYGCACVNNPVKFINGFSIDTNTYSEYTKHNGVLCINKTGNGGAGYCFIRRGQFALNPSVFLCELLTPLTNTNACYIGYQLHKIYSRGNSMNIDKFNTQSIDLIINDNEFEQLKENFAIKQAGLLLPLANVSFKQVKLSDVLEVVKPIKAFQISKTTPGNIPLISSTSTNNGIAKFVNDYNVDMDENYITIARNGSVGCCFVQCGKVAITQDVLICKLLDDTINIHLLAIVLTNKLTSTYSYSNKLTIDKLLEETISYPL